MASNDLILLDSILAKLAESEHSSHELSERFELFSFDQLLKDYDLSVDEMQLGWVDGSDDGGIDGFYTLIDGRLVTGSVKSSDYRKSPEIELIIVTCKHDSKFQQIPINNIIASTKELFDLSKNQDEIKSVFNDELLHSREIFRDAYIEIAAKNPSLKIKFYYVSRGDTAKVAPNAKARSNLLINQTEEQFTSSIVTFDYIGATELLLMHRRARIFSLRLKFIESVISRSNSSYIILSRLDDYFRFITDENDKLRRYLFDSNVRDYLPASLINQDIAETLSSNEKKEDMDFWLLNNGVTILTSNASVVGKEMSLENIQIVNGLQTTETIFNHFANSGNSIDDRALLIKVIVANDESLRDRIIKATNNQNKVDLSNLKATDKLQKDIEDVLLTHGWYYDRRKNFYRNQGIPTDQIISVWYIGQAVVGLILQKLEMAARNRPGYLTNESTYGHVFNDKWNIQVFAAVVVIRKKIELLLYSFDFENDKVRHSLNRYGIIFAYIYIVQKLGKLDYKPDELITLMNNEISMDEIRKIWELIKESREKFYIKTGTRNIKRLPRNVDYLELLKSILSVNISK